MSERWECDVCHGVYADASSDGVPYFHACPPIANPAYQPDPTLPGFDPRTQVERPGHRDENPKPPPNVSPDGNVIGAGPGTDVPITGRMRFAGPPPGPLEVEATRVDTRGRARAARRPARRNRQA